MVIVIVEHYLNEAGQRYFPAWLEEVEQILREWSGFISIEQIRKVEQSKATWLLLRFENLPLLRAWAKSEDHQGILDLLAPFRERKQHSQIFECGGKLR